MQFLAIEAAKDANELHGEEKRQFSVDEDSKTGSVETSIVTQPQREKGPLHRVIDVNQPKAKH